MPTLVRTTRSQRSRESTRRRVTHVKALQAGTVSVEGVVVEIGELLGDGVDVGHG